MHSDISFGPVGRHSPDIIASLRDGLAQPEFPIALWAARIAAGAGVLLAMLWLRLLLLLFGQSTGGVTAPFFWLTNLLVEPWRWFAQSYSVRDTGFFEFACFVAIEGYLGLTLLALAALFGLRYWAQHTATSAEMTSRPSAGVDLRTFTR